MNIAQGKRSLRVVFVGGFGGGNIGNDTSIAVALDVLRSTDPDARAVIATTTPRAAADRFGTVAVGLQRGIYATKDQPTRARRLVAAAQAEVGSLGEVWRLVRDSDLVLVPGTGILDDFGEPPWGMPLSLATWSVASRLAQRPFVLAAIGAGPIRNPACRVEMALAARLAHRASFRDLNSKEFVAGLRAGRPDDRVTIDIVFGYPVPAASTPHVTAPSLRVGLGVMAYGGWGGQTDGPSYATYLAELTRLARDLLAAGHQLTFLVGQDVDEPAVAELMARLDPAERARCQAPPIGNYAELLRAVDGTDIAIVTRYHNLVAALSMGRPAISFGYAPKNAALLEQVGLAGFDSPVEGADAGWAMGRLRALQSGTAALRPDLPAVLHRWHQSVRADLAEVYVQAGAASRRSRAVRRAGGTPA